MARRTYASAYSGPSSLCDRRNRLNTLVRASWTRSSPSLAFPHSSVAYRARAAPRLRTSSVSTASHGATVPLLLLLDGVLLISTLASSRWLGTSFRQVFTRGVAGAFPPPSPAFANAPFRGDTPAGSREGGRSRPGGRVGRFCEVCRSRVPAHRPRA